MRARLTILADLLRARGALVLAVGVLAGLLLPQLAHALRPLLAPAVAGLLFCAMLRVDFGAFLGHVTRPYLVLAVVCWLLVVTPAVATPLLGALPMPAGLRVALVLMTVAPPIISSPAFALLVGLDAPLLLAVTLICVLLAPFSMAMAPVVLPGIGFPVDAGTLFVRLAVLIGGCLASAAVTRRALGTPRLLRWSVALDLVVVALLLLFAVAIMDGVTARLLRDPWHVALFTTVSFVANLALQAASALVFHRTGWRRALSVGFAGGNRSMGLWLAVLPASASPDIMLYFAVGQLPMYVLPALLARLYARAAGR